MRVTFFSNFLNHHQIPFCNEMYKILKDDFKFVATESIPLERLQMGYKDYSKEYSYAINSYENEENYSLAIKLAYESDVVILGSAPSFLLNKRLKENKLTFRYSERIFKDGKYKLLNPKAIYAYYKLYSRHRYNKNFHMLCASSYTAKDMRILAAFPNKTWKWGYFPESQLYDIESLLNKKNKEILNILWVGRFLDWKNPSIGIRLAKLLKENNYKFKLNFIGCGQQEAELKKLTNELELIEHINFLGAMSPQGVREYMKNSNIFLFTSNYKEGWGAVLNEAMNSGCAIIASEEAGATKFLIENGKNGFTYSYDNINELYDKVKLLIENTNLRNKISKNAYLTIVDLWNSKIAANRFLNICKKLLDNKSIENLYKVGPCSKAK